jgi:hypothetical protein
MLGGSDRAWKKYRKRKRPRLVPTGSPLIPKVPERSSTQAFAKFVLRLRLRLTDGHSLRLRLGLGSATKRRAEPDRKGQR